MLRQKVTGYMDLAVIISLGYLSTNHLMFVNVPNSICSFNNHSLALFIFHIDSKTGCVITEPCVYITAYNINQQRRVEETTSVRFYTETTLQPHFHSPLVIQLLLVYWSRSCRTHGATVFGCLLNCY